MKITDLKPTIVWKFFHQVTQVPRPSKKGRQNDWIPRIIRERVQNSYQERWSRQPFNVKACHSGNGGSSGSRIAVSHGYGLRENNGTKHDFDNDPIETIVDGEWLRANGTTLGADNGIGVAAELALLASDDIQHGPIECLFTVDEETGLTGAKALKEGLMPEISC